MFPKTIASIGKLRLTLTTDNDISPFVGELRVQFLDPNGIEQLIKTFDVTQQLSVTQQNALANLMAQLRNKASTEAI